MSEVFIQDNYIEENLIFQGKIERSAAQNLAVTDIKITIYLPEDQREKLKSNKKKTKFTACWNQLAKEDTTNFRHPHL